MARPQITRVPGYERGELKGTEAPKLALSIRAELAKIQQASPNTDTVRLTAAGTYEARVWDRTILCDTTAGDIIVQLPLATKRIVLPYTIVKTSSDTNQVRIVPKGTDTIAGAIELAWVEAEQAYTMHPDGVDTWWPEGVAASALAAANAHSDARDVITLASAEAYTDAHHAWTELTGVPANISAVAALVGAADTLPYFTGLGALALAALTTYGRTILACANAAAARAALALGTLATLSTVTETELTLIDVTTANVSTTKHGFAPKLPNDATKYLDGTGAYSVPAGGGGGSPPAFPTISNWELGLDAALSVTTHVDGRVSQITDVSGNVRNATNGSTAGKPRYLPSGFNAKYPGWAFDGLSVQHLVVTLPNISAPATVVIVMQDLSVGTGDGNLYRDQTGRGVGYLQGGNSWSIFAGTSGFQSTALWDQNKAMLPLTMGGAPAVRIDLYNGASSLIANNATEVTGTAATSTVLFGGTLNIGNGASAVTTAAKMVLRAFHIFSKALTLAERDSLRAYYGNTNVAGITI